MARQRTGAATCPTVYVEVMPELPSGTITFLFTDIEGSTRLIQELPEQYQTLFATHDQLTRQAIRDHGGIEVRTEGDSFFVVFTSAPDAVQVAVDIQRSLATHTWPDGHPICVRMGLHTGQGTVSGNDYVGLDVHRAARIADAGHGGQVLLSDVTRALTEQMLPDGVTTLDLGEHTLKDLAAPEHLHQLVIPDHRADFPELRTVGVPVHNLPAQPTSFVGRGDELDESEELLRSSSLLTLTGIGGGGKTRLGLELAARLVGGYRDGAWFVDLSPITDPSVVRREVAGVLGTVEPNLISYLRDRQLLLVLDACERVLDACSELAGEILRGAAEVRILATSWEPLAIPGEVVYPVPLLPVPGDGNSDVDTTVAAVDLFVDRATAVDPSFALTEENRTAVIEIVRQIDGIPLAIELAAARVNVLPPEQIALRLENRFQMLTGTRRTDAGHHQTLEAAIAWGYELLSEGERLLFNRLCTFRGDFSLEAAEQVAASDPIEQWAVLDLLSGLVRRALVVTAEPDVGGAARFRIMETLREFGRKRLRESAEANDVLQRHADFYIQLAERLEPRVFGPDMVAVTSGFDRDHDNFRAVLEWSLDSDRPQLAVQLTGAMFWFWILGGHIDEGGEWVERALAAADVKTGTERARALLTASGMALQRDETRELAVQRMAEALQMYEELGDNAGMAHAIRYQAQMAWLANDTDRTLRLSTEAARLAQIVGASFVTAASLALAADVSRTSRDYNNAGQFLEEGLAAAEESGAPLVLALLLGVKAAMARDRGQHELATSTYEETLSLVRMVGHAGLIGATLTGLGSVVWQQGEHDTARRLHEEALAEFKRRGTRSALVFGFKSAAVGQMEIHDLGIALDRYTEWAAMPRKTAVASSLAESLRNLGRLARRQGRADDAAALITDSLALAAEAENQTQLILGIAESAALAVDLHRNGEAAMLLGAAEAQITTTGVALRSVEQRSLDETASTIDDLAAQEIGRAMSLGEAVAFAQDQPGARRDTRSAFRDAS